MPPKKVDHSNTKCCICGSINTYIKNPGNPLWYTCSCNRKNCTGYMCVTCYLRQKRYGSTNINVIENIKKEYHKKKFEGLICLVCGSNLSAGNQRYKYRDKKGNWSGKSYLCPSCHSKDYEKNDPNSRSNLMKSIANLRTGELDTNDPKYKGYIGEIVFVMARKGKAKNYNIETDNFNSSFDVIDIEYGSVQVKTATLIGEEWKFTDIRTENCDNVAIIGMDKNYPWKDVECVHIVPIQMLGMDESITIPKYISSPKRERIYRYYEKFRVDYEQYNDAYHVLMSYIKDNKRFSIDNIKELLKDQMNNESKL